MAKRVMKKAAKKTAKKTSAGKAARKPAKIAAKKKTASKPAPKSAPRKAGGSDVAWNFKLIAHDTLAGLLQKDRQLPIVNPDDPAQQKLSQFPSQRIIEQGNKLVQQIVKAYEAFSNGDGEHQRAQAAAVPSAHTGRASTRSGR